MPDTRLFATAAVVLALTTLGYPTGLFGSDTAQTSLALEASAGSLFDDVDGDLVPNCIEDLMQTDPLQADSDGDGIDDFEEILTFTSHDSKVVTKPVDHAMRVLATSSFDASGRSVVHLHLMLRYVKVKLKDISFRGLYADLRGTRYSLQTLMSSVARVTTRQRSRDGTSFLFSIKMSSESDLKRILPCTIGAVAIIGNAYHNTGTYLMESGADVGALLPFGNGSLALQAVSSSSMLQDESPFYRGGGRVCEMELSKVGSSSKGVVCEVTSAKCSAAPGLRCSMSCSKKTGSVITVPDGLGTITGG